MICATIVRLWTPLTTSTYLFFLLVVFDTNFCYYVLRRQASELLFPFWSWVVVRSEMESFVGCGTGFLSVMRWDGMDTRWRRGCKVLSAIQRVLFDLVLYISEGVVLCIYVMSAYFVCSNHRCFNNCLFVLIAICCLL